MDEYRAAVLGFGKQFLRIIALALDLDEQYFDYMTTFPMCGLRALHYPPQEKTDDVGIGMSEACICKGGVGADDEHHRRT